MRPPHDARAALQVAGLFTIPVQLRGEGCPLALELANPAQQRVNFGSVMARQSATRTVPLVNRSRAPVTLSLAPAMEVGAGAACCCLAAAGGVYCACPHARQAG